MDQETIVSQCDHCGLSSDSPQWNLIRCFHNELNKPDMVNHPPHYTNHPSGVECIQITEHYNFNIGNAIKYLWRANEKGKHLEDLKKAAWYINREIERLSR